MSYLTQAVTSTSLYTYMVPHFWNNASFFFNFFEKSGKFTPTSNSSATYFEANYNRNSPKAIDSDDCTLFSFSATNILDSRKDKVYYYCNDWNKTVHTSLYASHDLGT